MAIEPIHYIPMTTEFNSPFSSAFAVEDCRLLFLSGAGGIPPYHKHPHDPEEESKWLNPDFRKQTEDTFNYINQILESQGATFKNIVKMTVYFKDPAKHQDIFNEVSREIFGTENPPARTAIGAGSLAHDGVLIEVDVIAAVPKKGKAN